MHSVELRHVTKRYGAVQAIGELSLTVDKGSFTALLGPSGCGKSTLLRMIAGLEEITEGQCFIDDVDVTDVPPAKRRIAMVFQSYALYPHMTVRQNIAFSLSIAGASRKVQNEKTAVVARMLQLEPLLDRRPAQLSGGQRQRVAIGRALVREPRVFLFDEPLSNLDAMLRVQMRLELAKLHQDLGTTMIYVTHDQTEAMTLADKIVVLDKGRISQVGTPLELYNSPANKFVASFIGSPGMNFFGVQLKDVGDGRAHVELPGGRSADVPVHSAGVAAGRARVGRSAGTPDVGCERRPGSRIRRRRRDRRAARQFDDPLRRYAGGPVDRRGRRQPQHKIRGPRRAGAGGAAGASVRREGGGGVRGGALPFPFAGEARSPAALTALPFAYCYGNRLPVCAIFSVP